MPDYTLSPVEGDPFAQKAPSQGFSLRPVEGDPFAQQQAPGSSRDSPLLFEPGKTSQAAVDAAHFIKLPNESAVRERKLQEPAKPEDAIAPDTEGSYDLSDFPAPAPPPHSGFFGAPVAGAIAGTHELIQSGQAITGGRPQ